MIREENQMTEEIIKEAGLPITQIDSYKIKNGQYIERGYLYNENGKRLGPAPTKEYASADEMREEREREIEERKEKRK